MEELERAEKRDEKISVKERREEERKEDKNTKYFREVKKGVDNVLHTGTHQAERKMFFSLSSQEK